jgi:hypothetical protein
MQRRQLIVLQVPRCRTPTHTCSSACHLLIRQTSGKPDQPEQLHFKSLQQTSSAEKYVDKLKKERPETEVTFKTHQ